MKKEQKKVPAKRLPALLKKSYTEKALEKKLLKKLYIKTDRDFLAAQFTADEKDPLKKRIAVTEYPDADFIRLKNLAKQIKRQKGRIKLIPLAAAAGFIGAVIILTGLFKNPIAKRVLINVLQKAAGAKVEIASVNVGIFNSALTVNGLAVADKNAPMKNVFEAQKLEADFNLVQLLKKRFVCENLEVSGMAFGTERKTSGALAKREKKVKKDKNTDKAEPGKTAAFMQAQQQAALAEGQQILDSMFAALNPQTFLDNALKQLKTPEEAQKAQELAERLIPVWEKRPAELESSVNDFRSSAEKVLSRDYQTIKDIAEIKSAIEDLNTAIQNGKKLSALTESTVKELQTDSKAVKDAARRASDAVKSDTAFINKEIGKIKSFTVADGKNIFSQTLKAAAYGALGKYYPYAEKAMELLSREDLQKKTKKEVKKQRQRRMRGRTIEYKADVYPRFLIQRMFASGTGFESLLGDISSDPDLWGKPVSFEGSLDEGAAGLGTERTHKADGIVNAGKKLKDPLFKASYTGSGYKVSFNPASVIIQAAEAAGGAVDTAGIPSFAGRAAIRAGIKAEKDGRFGIEADFDFDKVLLSAQDFEPAFISRIYNESLAAVRNLRFSVQSEFSSSGARMDIQTDADKVFIAALQKGINKELETVKKQAVQQAQAELEKYTGPLNDKLAVFGGIEKGIISQKEAVDLIQKELENRKKELTQRAENAGKEALNKAKDKAVDAAAEKAKEAAGDAAGKALKGLFGR
ncbi:TIGR03545 family protein [Treponema sp. OMZ 840]|uniref:TIGR03545 family protein n=1 Tax=Treponema sp. OMZ 840 TaxID=244313 RepID=UPI003D8A64B8